MTGTNRLDLPGVASRPDARPPEDADFAVACFKCDAPAIAVLKVGDEDSSAPMTACDEHREQYENYEDYTVEVLQPQTRTVRGANEFTDLHDFESSGGADDAE